jgi:hypothetical protein
MKKIAQIIPFLTLLAWPLPSFACPEYMVLTCEARQQANNQATVAREGWRNRQVRIIGPTGDLEWKGRVETYEPTGRVRIYDEKGDLQRNFKWLLPEYAR